jgi:ankyrin repeat protein
MVSPGQSPSDSLLEALKASVLALLALRADIELRSATGQTALHLAAIRGHPEITQADVGGIPLGKRKMDRFCRQKC